MSEQEQEQDQEYDEEEEDEEQDEDEPRDLSERKSGCCEGFFDCNLWGSLCLVIVAVVIFVVLSILYFNGDFEKAGLRRHRH
mmetsp:Transcript_9967/g.14638  ORF Transcript_9967/g.14638 Transcript_9967/m.14638 type:complete len:82 (+) Transcript_9967:131-376(+)